MEITLMCPGASSGQAAFRAELIEGIRAPERRYNIQDGKVVLSGFDDVILHHDADELLANPMYRMPTPAEQDTFAQQAQQSGQIQENTGQKEAASGNDSASIELTTGQSGNEPPDVPPAVDDSAQGKKKASGG